MWAQWRSYHTLQSKGYKSNVATLIAILQKWRSEKMLWEQLGDIQSHSAKYHTVYHLSLFNSTLLLKPEIFHINQVITMVVDALVPRIPRPSAAMILNTGLRGPCLPGGIISPTKSLLKKDSKCKYLCFLHGFSTTSVNIPLQSHRFSWSRGTAFLGWSVEQRKKISHHIIRCTVFHRLVKYVTHLTLYMQNFSEWTKT